MANTKSINVKKRLKIPSGSVWEEAVGYSRVMRVGRVVEVAGTTATDQHGQVVGKDDPMKQTKFIIEKIKTYLAQAGASLDDVVRTRMYVTNIDHWQAIGRVHGEFFKDIKPVATMVEVQKLIDPQLLVEIEMTAIIDEK